MRRLLVLQEDLLGDRHCGLFELLLEARGRLLGQLLLPLGAASGLTVALSVVVLVGYLHFLERGTQAIKFTRSFLYALVALKVLLRVNALHLPLLLKRDLEDGSSALLHDVGGTVAHIG